MYEELKKLAESATPGPWYEQDDEDSAAGAIFIMPKSELWAPPICRISVEANAAFVAAANPSAVLALIAEVERLKREEKNDAIAYKAAIERQEEMRVEFKEWQASHHANYCKAADERDQLKAENEALRANASLLDILPELDEALEDLEIHGQHSDQGYRKLKDWYRKIDLACKSVDAAIAKDAGQ